MITEDTTLINQYISVTKDTAGLNTAAFVAGIVEGILDAADFVFSLPLIHRFCFSISLLVSPRLISRDGNLKPNL